MPEPWKGRPIVAGVIFASWALQPADSSYRCQLGLLGLAAASLFGLEKSGSLLSGWPASLCHLAWVFQASLIRLGLDPRSEARFDFPLRCEYPVAGVADREWIPADRSWRWKFMSGSANRAAMWL